MDCYEEEEHMEILKELFFHHIYLSNALMHLQIIVGKMGLIHNELLLFFLFDGYYSCLHLNLAFFGYGFYYYFFN